MILDIEEHIDQVGRKAFPRGGKLDHAWHNKVAQWLLPGRGSGFWGLPVVVF